MTKFIFLRHGESIFNQLGRWQGHTNVPLNDVGRAQASQAAVKLTGLGITQIISSDLCRAAETAEIVNQNLQVPYRTDAGLRERFLGMLQGMTAEEINARPAAELYHTDVPEPAHEQDYLPRDAETLALLEARVKTSIFTALAQHPQDVILFVSHGGVFRALLRQLSIQPFRTENAVPYVFEKTGDSWQVNLAL